MTSIVLIGQTVTTTRVNVRQGAPNMRAPVLRKLDAGAALAVQAVVTGESVQGNAQWYLIDQQGYVWSGGCAALASAGSGPIVPGGVPIVVDLYHGDNVTSFAQAYGAGLRGVIHKATTGQAGQDPLYAQRRDRAKQAGLMWGAYHWGTADPAGAQVDNFLSTAKPDGDTLVALDFETDEGNQMTLDGARAFLQGIEQKLGRRAVLYSGDTIKSLLGTKTDAFFGQHRLWLAQYGNRPIVQASWPSYWLWQYSNGVDGPDPKTVPGIPGSGSALDCDHFQGTKDQLRAQWAS